MVGWSAELGLPWAAKAREAAEGKMGSGRWVANTRATSSTCWTSKAPHVIQLKGPYDIAVDAHPENDGTYGLTTDWWDGHAAKEVGIGCGRLLQSYGIHKTIREACLAWERANLQPGG